MKRKSYSHRPRQAIPPSRHRSHLYHRTEPASQLRLPSIPLRPLLAVAGFLLIIWALFLSPLFRVDTIRITGLHVVPKDQVQQKVAQIVTDSSFLLLPRDSEWLFPSGTIAKKLKQSFPSLSSVRISHKFPHSVTVAVVEQPVSLIWETGGRRYLVSGKGVATGTVPKDYKPKLVVTDSANLSVAVGRQILSPSFIDFIQTVCEQLPRTVHTKVAKVTVAETTLEATVLTAAGYSIYFDTTRSPNKQLGYLKEIVDQTTAQHQTLDYVDLRVNDRIFYKLK